MTDTGARSIEVSIVNSTQAAFKVETANLYVAGNKWIPGEEAKPGQIIEQFQGVLWGAYTDDINDTVGATIQLTGWGDAMRVQFTNDWYGRSTVTVITNALVDSQVTKIDTNDPQHSAYQVQLFARAKGTVPAALRGARGTAAK